MSESNIKVEFAVGSQVSTEHFFKSSFARSFVNNYREVKSLDIQLMNSQNHQNFIDNQMDKFNDKGKIQCHSFNENDNVNDTDSLSKKKKDALDEADLKELEQLRKQCQLLTEENHRLENTLQLQQTPQVQMIDSVLLQTQIDTLQWQLKQTEANCQMYRSLMKQVVNFLERTHKSLEYLQTNTSKNKTCSRNIRSQSIYIDEGATKDRLSPDKSIFNRAKSINQISSSSNSNCDLRESWSVLRRNDPVKLECRSSNNLSKTFNRNLYKRCNTSADIKASSDHIPPEKLSQEAFRLMRTVESLLTMREPDLVIVSSGFSSSSSTSSYSCSSSSTVTVDDDNHNSSKNKQSISDETSSRYSSFSERMFDKDSVNFDKQFNSLSNIQSQSGNQSFDTASLHSMSSKIVEEDVNSNNSLGNKDPSTRLTSTPIRKGKKFESKDVKSIKDDKQQLNSNSADDESGFSSMNSFQDVGLPIITLSPSTPLSFNSSCSTIKEGCHTEIGLPKIPIDNINHRRWSSSPASNHAIFKKYTNGFLSNSSNVESLSVWV